MIHPSDLQIFVLTSSLAIYVSAFANEFYICLHGIRYMDSYFSNLKDYRLESVSPFDRLARMHRYSFGYTFRSARTEISKPMRFWLFFTSISLTLHWAMFAGVCFAYAAGIDRYLYLPSE